MNTVCTVVSLRAFTCAPDRETEHHGETATLSYDSREPHEVTVTFHAGGPSTPPWRFARSLLSEGLARPAGDGDVRIWPCADRGALSIRHQVRRNGWRRYEAPAATIAYFLTMTYRLVPEGGEPPRTDIDHVIAAILNDGGAQ